MAQSAPVQRKKKEGVGEGVRGVADAQLLSGRLILDYSQRTNSRAGNGRRARWPLPPHFGRVLPSRQGVKVTVRQGDPAPGGLRGSRAPPGRSSLRQAPARKFWIRASRFHQEVLRYIKACLMDLELKYWQKQPWFTCAESI